MAVEQPEVAAVVEREVRIAAPPETVFDFFVDPHKMMQWKGRTAELEPWPGGIYRVEINDEATVRGEYVELDRPRRVVFTWGWEGQESGVHAVPPGSSRVEVDLIPDGDGTLVRLRHLETHAGTNARLLRHPPSLRNRSLMDVEAQETARRERLGAGA